MAAQGWVLELWQVDPSENQTRPHSRARVGLQAAQRGHEPSPGALQAFAGCLITLDVTESRWDDRKIIPTLT